MQQDCAHPWVESRRAHGPRGEEEDARSGELWPRQQYHDRRDRANCGRGQRGQVRHRRHRTTIGCRTAVRKDLFAHTSERKECSRQLPAAARRSSLLGLAFKKKSGMATLTSEALAALEERDAAEADERSAMRALIEQEAAIARRAHVQQLLREYYQLQALSPPWSPP